MAEIARLAAVSPELAQALDAETRTSERLRGLQAVTAALARSLTGQAAAEAVVHEGRLA